MKDTLHVISLAMSAAWWWADLGKQWHQTKGERGIRVVQEGGRLTRIERPVYYSALGEVYGEIESLGERE